MADSAPGAELEAMKDAAASLRARLGRAAQDGFFPHGPPTGTSSYSSHAAGTAPSGSDAGAPASSAALRFESTPLGGHGVAVVGLGGVGASVTAALARAGVGRLVLVDAPGGRVCASDVATGAFAPAAEGLPRCAAMEHSLGRLGRGVSVKASAMDVGSEDGLEAFRGCLVGRDGERKVGVVVCVVDSEGGAEEHEGMRAGVNEACLVTGTPVVEVNMYALGMLGTVRLCLAGKTACLQCIDHSVGALRAEEELAKETPPPVPEDEEAPDGSGRSWATDSGAAVAGAVAAASTSIVAGIAVDMVVTLLTGDGDEYALCQAALISVQSLSDMLLASKSEPNIVCPSEFCRRAQAALGASNSGAVADGGPAALEDAAS